MPEHFFTVPATYYLGSSQRYICNHPSRIPIAPPGAHVPVNAPFLPTPQSLRLFLAFFVAYSTLPWELHCLCIPHFL